MITHRIWVDAIIRGDTWYGRPLGLKACLVIKEKSPREKVSTVGQIWPKADGVEKTGNNRFTFFFFQNEWKNKWINRQMSTR